MDIAIPITSERKRGTVVVHRDFMDDIGVVEEDIALTLFVLVRISAAHFLVGFSVKVVSTLCVCLNVHCLAEVFQGFFRLLLFTEAQIPAVRYISVPTRYVDVSVASSIDIR
uniref:Uncharacterized protein n=2 Tax=Rhizophora mucronata TaxID=61149 RepID=A0A2P2L799_RHIMU